MDKLILLIVFLTACTPSATSTKSSASADSAADSAADASASQGMQHTEAGTSVPIIINCVQVYTNDPNVRVGPCIYREGTKLPFDSINDK